MFFLDILPFLHIGTKDQLRVLLGCCFALRRKYATMSIKRQFQHGFKCGKIRILRNQNLFSFDIFFMMRYLEISCRIKIKLCCVGFALRVVKLYNISLVVRFILSCKISCALFWMLELIFHPFLQFCLCFLFLVKIGVLMWRMRSFTQLSILFR